MKNELNRLFATLEVSNYLGLLVNDKEIFIYKTKDFIKCNMLVYISTYFVAFKSLVKFLSLVHLQQKMCNMPS